MITLLLDAGADPKARSTLNQTPLHRAAIRKGPAVITLLLDAGADPKARDKIGQTPLHWAAQLSPNPAVITALLDAGANPKVRNEDGKIPWDLVKDREELQDSDVYWRLHDGQF